MRKQSLIKVLLCLLLVCSLLGYGCAVPDAGSAQLPTAGPSTATRPTMSIGTLPTPTLTQPTQPAPEPTEGPVQPPIAPPTRPTQPEEPVYLELSAQNAFVYDFSQERFLYIHGDPDGYVEPASITKLFSAYVGLQYLRADAVLTVGEEVDWIAYGSSRASLRKGYRLTAQMCVQAMIIPSGNDAAYVLAVNGGRAIAQDPQLPAREAYTVFVAEMNRQAQALGMTGTVFVNPDGMNESGHHTTMRDLVEMARIALETPLILDAAQTPALTVELASGQTLDWHNSNQLVNPEHPAFYCLQAIGLKTGSTSSAGKCLLSAFRLEDRILVICAMGCPENEDRYIDVLKMLEAFM